MSPPVEGEQVTVENIPIVRRRGELKKKSREFHAVLRDRRKDMDKLERRLHIEISFVATASNTAARKREFQDFADKHAEWKELTSEIEKLENQTKELDDVISDINFYQRERMVIAGNRYADAVDALSDKLGSFMETTGSMAVTVERFNSAVDKFAAARGK